MHVSNRNVRWDDVLNTLAQMYRMDTPCPCVLSLGMDEIPISEYRKASPPTRLFQRVWGEWEKTLDWPVQTWRDRFITNYASRQGADWNTTNNEVNRWDPAALQWWFDQMAWCIANQFPITIFNWGVGNPPGDQLAVWNDPMMLKILRLIRDTYRPDGRPLFVLNLHQYDLGDPIACDWTGKDDIQRWKKTILPLLPADLQARPPWLVHTEKGQSWGTRLSQDQLLAKMRNDEAISATEPYLLGNCYWAVGDTGKGASEDYTGDNLAPKLGAWLRMYA